MNDPASKTEKCLHEFIAISSEEDDYEELYDDDQGETVYFGLYVTTYHCVHCNEENCVGSSRRQ